MWFSQNELLRGSQGFGLSDFIFFGFQFLKLFILLFELQIDLSRWYSDLEFLWRLWLIFIVISNVFQDCVFLELDYAFSFFKLPDDSDAFTIDLF
jgi:hypothetical protein